MVDYNISIKGIKLQSTNIPTKLQFVNDTIMFLSGSGTLSWQNIIQRKFLAKGKH